MMGEAKQKRLHGVGPVLLQPSVDMDVAIEDLEKLVDAGVIAGFVQIAVLDQVAPGLSPLKVWSFGLEKQQVYDALCIAKKSLEDTMGFKEVE